ncbi:metallophosphoesterase [Sphingosinicella sp. BN140058]|uniref:metallophosphoesterase n=1 Tax=Sphingosinicella sp. BN140058 TaxID=1892855 RepID=UPI001010407F|nr:metallophosphoesterase [Sphingosinicella sp. BN140058]QAY80228.1 metallophosphoesterase [Sphingosinicella sp. BN140058]
MRIARHDMNRAGRDFVVGDIHGTYSVVAAALNGVQFDWANDRLFSVGDLVDRGPESRRVRAFINNPRIFPCRGNHEDMFLEMYETGDTPPEEAVRFWTRKNGMSWWMDVPQDERLAIIAAFRTLPIIQEIETERGLVGLVHGEVPHGMDWATFKAAIEAGDKHTTMSALWGRDRISHRNDSGVKGIDRVFCGHTPVDAPTQLGNVYYIDSGSFMGVARDDPDSGRLTIASLISATQTFRRIPMGEFFDIRDEPVTDRPFGEYAS